MGVQGSGVLVDITPYTFGTSALGEVNGVPSHTMFVPLIRRNTKLPAKRSEVFFTVKDRQEMVDVRIYQGENPDAEDNVLLGNYLFPLTEAPAGSEIVIQFDLDLNGILKVRAVERKTGKHIDATIENAISRFSAEELAETRSRVDRLWSGNGEPGEARDALPGEFESLIHRAETILPSLEEDDQSDIIDLIEDLREALANHRMEDAEQLKSDLDDTLFYLEG
jgi:molecular chaperone DnaK (HSP70)